MRNDLKFLTVADETPSSREIFLRSSARLATFRISFLFIDSSSETISSTRLVKWSMTTCFLSEQASSLIPTSSHILFSLSKADSRYSRNSFRLSKKLIHRTAKLKTRPFEKIINKNLSTTKILFCMKLLVRCCSKHVYIIIGHLILTLYSFKL